MQHTLTLPSYHEPVFVVLSILIAIIASYTALDLTISIANVRGRVRTAGIAFGALAMGTGIWSMHFTAMLAFRLPGLPIAYEVRFVVASILIAIIASAVALYVFTLPTRSSAVAVAAGIAMAIAISGMHYTGMAGLRTQARIEWHGLLVAASVAVALIASFIALDFARRVQLPTSNRLATRLVGGVMLGFAIVGMHYTGMAAATYHPGAVTYAVHATVLASTGLAVAVIGGTVLILALAVGGSFLARLITRRMESEVFYRSLIENASDLMLVMDRKAIRRFVSPSYERILGYNREEMLGTLAYDCVHPEDLAGVKAVVKDLEQRPGDTERLTFRARHADGHYLIVDTIIKNLLDDPAVHGYIVTAKDQTEQRKLELQVQHAQKMEAVGKLAGGIAHDFNNLLTVIMGNLQVLAEEVVSKPAAAEVIAEVQGAAQRAAALTRQLLAFSRRQVLQPRLLQINEVVRGIHKMIARLLGADIEFRLELADGLPDVRADAGQVEQAILNLAVNARDAMPAGGLLTIKSSYVTSRPADVIPADHEPADAYVCLEVSDTGSGMEQVVLDRIFEPFFTTKEIGQGTGLGLATVFGIMNQSGGYVSVATEPGRGSRFQLLFPVVAAHDAEHATQHAGNGKSAHATVLLIEDEPAVRAFAQRALEKHGYQVLTAESGLAAVAAARDHKGPIHLVLSDVILPDINGRETFERISLMRHGARVLYMSGYTEDEAIHRGALTSGLNFLQKPFTPTELITKVKAALAD